MDLSIIIPVHNTEQFLPMLIKSIKAQETDYKYEVIFVLDACTDGSKKVIEKSRIADVIYECNERACGIARNKGMSFAKGDYIWFVDSDDEFLTEYAIQKALDFIKKENVNVVHIPFESDKFNQSCYAMVWQYIFKREFIEDIQFRRKQPGEDNKFMEDVFTKLGGYNIPSYDESLYFYRYLREGSNMFRHFKGEVI